MLDTVSLCCRIVLNIPLTVGGSRVSAYGATPPPAAWPCGMEGGHRVRASRFARKMQARASIGKADRAPSGGRGSHVPRSRVKRSVTKAQAIRPWIHVALSLLPPFARLLRRLTTAVRPCVCGTNVAAMPEQRHTSRTVPSTQRCNRTLFGMLLTLLYNMIY